MNLETKHNLDSNTISKLQELIRINIDSVDGFREAAEEVKDASVAQLFRDIAADRSNMASELQEYVEWNGEEAAKKGTIAAAIHRTWIDIRGLISGGDTHAILAECERGEDSIKHTYEDTLKATAGSAMNDVLLSQYSVVKAGHDRVRDLRDAYKNRK